LDPLIWGLIPSNMGLNFLVSYFKVRVIVSSEKDLTSSNHFKVGCTNEEDLKTGQKEGILSLFRGFGCTVVISSGKKMKIKQLNRRAQYK
jgi:hypothetical protein